MAIEDELNLLGKLHRLPALYLLIGAFPGVWVVFRHQTSRNTSAYLIAFLCVLSASVFLLAIRFDARLTLFLAGAGIFGLYAGVIQHADLRKRNRLGGGQRRLAGVYRGEHRFVVAGESGPVGAVLYVSNSDWARGDRLDVTLDVRWPTESRGFRRYLAVQRYHGVGEVKTVHERVSTGRGSWLGLYGRVEGFLSNLGDRWKRSAQFQRALILGQKEALPAGVLRTFRRLGVSHLFVISGLHVGILFWLMHRLFEPLDRNLGLGAGAGLVFVYVSFLGWPVSAVRAALMIGLFCLAKSAWRRPDGPVLLVSAVLLMLAWNPFTLLDVGFQLSVGAMVGIYGIHRYANRFVAVPGLSYFLYSTGAFLGVMPLVLIHFHYVPRLGFLFGWLGSLAFPALLVGLGLQMGFMALGWSLPADAGEWVLMSGEAWVRETLRGTDLVLTVSDMHVLTALALGLLLWVVVDGNRFPRMQGTALVGVLVFLLAVVLPPTRPHLEVTNMNRLPAVFVHNPFGVRVLVLPPGVYPDSGQLYRLERYLRSKGVVELDVLVSTLTRRRLRRMEPEFVVDRMGVHDAETGVMSWRGGRFWFSERRLDSYFVSMRYNIQEFVADSVEGPPYVLRCRGPASCRIESGPTRRKHKRSDGARYVLRNRPLRWVSPGRLRPQVRVKRTVEDRLVSFLPGF